MKFFVKVFLGKCDQIRSFPVTLNEKILHEKLHFYAVYIVDVKEGFAATHTNSTVKRDRFLSSPISNFVRIYFFEFPYLGESFRVMFHTSWFTGFQNIYQSKNFHFFIKNLPTICKLIQVNLQNHHMLAAALQINFFKIYLS